MKPLNFTLLLVLVLMPLSVRGDFNADFSQDPPYEMSNSVVGVDGWVQADQSGSANATIVDLGGDQVLALTGTNGFIQIRNPNASVRPDGNDMLFVSTKLGWGRNFTTQGASLSLGSADWANNNPLNIGFDSTYGIHFSVYDGTTLTNVTTLLSVSNTLHNGCLYDFDVALNFATKKFDITLTGIDASSNAVSVSMTNQTFYNEFWMGGIGFVFLQNNGAEYQDMYVQGINVVPEPSTLAFVSMGIFAAACMRRRRGRL